MIGHHGQIKKFLNLSAYKALGCWRESPVGGWAIPYSLELSASKLLEGDYADREDSINKCFLASYSIGYDIFALDGSRKCIGYKSNAQYSGTLPKYAYEKHGSSVHCDASGRGGGASLSVYEIVQGTLNILMKNA